MIEKGMIEDKNGGVLDSMEDEGIHQDEEDEATYKGKILLIFYIFQNMIYKIYEVLIFLIDLIKSAFQILGWK